MVIGLLQSLLMPLKIQVCRFLRNKKLKPELLSDPAIPLCVFIQKPCNPDLEMFTLQCSFISALFLNSHKVETTQMDE